MSVGISKRDGQKQQIQPTSEMQNHMSKYITKQNGEKTDDYVVRGITTKKTLNILLLQAHQKTKERPH